MPNANWGTTGLLSSTIEKIMPAFQQQIFSSKVLLWILSTANKVQNAPGGLSIVEPILYGASPNVGSYADYDVFSTDPNTGLSAAEFPWRQFYGLFHISGIELAMNSGEQAVINLAQARLDQLKLSMSEALNTMLYDDGTGNSGKDFLGLSAIIDDDRVLGGINSATAGNEYWDATVVPSAAGAAAALVAEMRTAYNTASEGSEHPTNIITTQATFEVYEDQLVDNARYTDMKMADAGFQNLLFKGRPIAFDNAADPNSVDPVWFLNVNYLKLRKLAETWFTPSDMLQPTNQDAFYKNILSYGNLTCNFPARQAVLTGAATALA